MFNLDYHIGRYSHREAQKFLDNLEYDWIMCEWDNEDGCCPYYRMDSPKKTLKRGKAICINGALVGAALTGLPPHLLSMEISGYNGYHTVLIVKQGGRYGTIGKSRCPNLTWRDCTYKSVEDLARSYGANSMSICRLEEEFPDWMTTDEDMYFGFRFTRSEKKRV